MSQRGYQITSVASQQSRLNYQFHSGKSISTRTCYVNIVRNFNIRDGINLLFILQTGAFHHFLRCYFMGNVRQSYIKNLAAKLIMDYDDEFSTDFEENKHKVTEYTNVKSKVIRNRVAGYIVRQKCIQLRTKISQV